MSCSSNFDIGPICSSTGDPDELLEGFPCNFLYWGERGGTGGSAQAIRCEENEGDVEIFHPASEAGPLCSRIPDEARNVDMPAYGKLEFNLSGRKFSIFQHGKR